MLCLLHGYLLEGSGSNLWTRCVVESLCRDGQTVQLVCQEPHPEQYDCIAEVPVLADGSVREALRARGAYRGKCIMHKPQLRRTLRCSSGTSTRSFEPRPDDQLQGEAIGSTSA